MLGERSRPTDIFLLPRTVSQSEQKSTSKDWRIQKLQQFLDTCDGRLGADLQQVLRQLGLEISASHATHLFQQELGIGVREYAKRRRLEVAATELGCCTRPIKEIAANLGYKSVGNFTRAFKACFNKNPREYRNTLRRLGAQRHS